MRAEYDFSKGKRGAVLRGSRGKTRITIRIDEDIVDWFRQAAHAAGGGSYQSMINEALRLHVDSSAGVLEDTIRRVLREELPRAARRRVAATGKR